MKWHKKLTKAELKHIRLTTNGTLASFKRNIEHIRQKEAATGECPCRECQEIARKLGI